MNVLTWFLVFISILLKPVKFIGKLLVRHALICMYHFDTVYDAPPDITIDQRERLVQYRAAREASAEAIDHNYFVLPICVWIFLFVDTGSILLKNKFEYNTNPMPEMITHRMYPPKYYQQGDMLVLAVSSGIVLMSATLFSRKWLSDRFCMYFVKDGDGQSLIVNGKVWDKKNSEKIDRFRRLNRKFIMLLCTSSHVVAYGYFLFNFIRAPFNDLKYYLVMIFYMPFLAWYCVWAAAFLFYHFFTATRYIMIKQQHLIQEQKELLRKIELQTRKHLNKPNLDRLWFQFRKLNGDFAYQCAEIRGYNHFWSPLLTIQFSVEMVTFCYLLYSCLFYQQTIDQFIYFVFFLIELGVLIFAVIGRCSMVDHYNDVAYAGNMKACILFQLHFGDIGLQQRTKMDTISTNRNFGRACFRLSNNYRLDSTAFNLAMYIISTFFLMICRRNRRKLMTDLMTDMN